MSGFLRQVDDLIAVTGELLDDELIEATRNLRSLAAEADDLDVRFNTAMLDVKRIIDSRISGQA